MTRLYILDVSPPSSAVKSIQSPLRHSFSSSSYSSSSHSSGFTSSSISSMSSHDVQLKSVKFSKVVVINNPTTVCLVQGETPGGTKNTINRHWLKV
ncbi:hypothetical protein BCR42DRAFT_424168 [Absidia repens]|uniref:Uncharacterized protein n=1 Tax=Absidia repens TaxID=90262 RepID=A0A1X2I446_9FUNG|nr:hypothetical protein BCR42DRAFT_424168 [Absidia repens]